MSFLFVLFKKKSGMIWEKRIKSGTYFVCSLIESFVHFLVFRQSKFLFTQGNIKQENIYFPSSTAVLTCVIKQRLILGIFIHYLTSNLP